MPATVVFGAFDRHNLGDLLFAHVAAALLAGEELVFAGLAARDLRDVGGHRVEALHALARDPRLTGARLVHAGGEILTCTARQAALMLQAPGHVDEALVFAERHPEAEAAWRLATLGTDAEVPYVASRADMPDCSAVVFAGVGGVAFDDLPAAARAAAVARLRRADAVTVRDAQTQAQLRLAGIAARLVPDPVVLIEQLFGPAIRERAASAPTAWVRERFIGGHVAVQLSADLGDDATLAALAEQLSAVAAGTGLGVLLLRAGMAPWHDDAAVLARLAGRLPVGRAHVFESVHAWDVCAALASARAFVGSSLHGCVVANAFGRPAVGLELTGRSGQGSKLSANASTWFVEDTAVVRDLDDLAPAVLDGLAGDPVARAARAGRRAAVARDALIRLMRGN